MLGKHRKENIKDKKKQLTRLRIVFLIITIIFIAITIRFYISIIKTNMLPTMYITIFTIVVAVITLLLALGLSKKHKTLKLNIISLILILIISAGYLFANHYVDATMNFLGKILTEVAEVEQYYVIVKKDSSYNKIEDVNNKEIYGFQVEEDVKQKIQNKITVTLNEGDNLTALGTSLMNNEIEVIVISLSQYNMLGEEVEGFKDNTKIIYTETHQIQVQSSIEDANSEYTIENGIFNVYISGIDVFGGINNVSRSDANIIATVNTKTHEVLLTSIPRDYYVTLHNKKAKDKLTHSGIYGINETVTTVEDLLGIDINYYVRVNFTTVIKLVDTLGGIDVYSDYAFTGLEGYSFRKGNNHLNGNSALAFSRERYSFKDGDNQRIKNQQKVIEAIMNKALSSTTILTKYSSILDSLSGSFNTNIDQNDISSIVKEQLEKMPSWKIKTISLTGTASEGPTYSLGSQLVSIMLPDEKSIEDARSAINAVMGK